MKGKLVGSLITLLNVCAPPDSFRSKYLTSGQAEGVLICAEDLNVSLNDELHPSGSTPSCLKPPAVSGGVDSGRGQLPF